jgi:hypothetical protein
MQGLTGILAGVLLSGASCLCAGMLLLNRLSLRLGRLEYLSLAFVAGSACFSQVVFALSSIHAARSSVFVVLALIAAGVQIGRGKRIAKPLTSTPLPHRWKWFMAALFTVFGVVYLVNAMAPEMSPDGAAYHLPFVDGYLRMHGFARIQGDFYASLSQGIELLFVPAVSLGGHSSAALLHFLFLLDLPLMMICYGSRFGFPVPAAAAAFLVFASPVVGWDGTSAYVDVAAAAILFAVFYLLEIWDSEGEANLLIVIGILAGFSYAAKYSAGIAVPYAVGYVSWKLLRRRRPLLAPVLTILAWSAVFILPWILRNAVELGNPLAPFANHLFPNPYVHVSFEQGYRTYLRQYHLASWVSAPWELSVKGERLQGFFGPVFLLMPVALFAWRRQSGRRLLLAGGIFAIPWLLNIGARFLIPALPPLALALTLAASRAPGVLPAILLLHGILSWYGSPIRYFDRYAPRIAGIPLRAALRIEPEETYLARSNAGYRIDRMIEESVPRGNRVFSFEAISKAWTVRQILVRDGGAGNEVLGDVLQNAMLLPDCGLRAVHFHFPPTRLRGIRAVQTASLTGEMWSIAEFQVLRGGIPLPVEDTWSFGANRNPWEARLAFDGSYVTRWRSWEDAAPGMFLGADFHRSRLLDEAILLTDPDAAGIRVSLRGMDASGQWHDLPAQVSTDSVSAEGNLRAEAVREVVARGIGYLLVTPGAFGANDFSENAALWGVRRIASSDGATLYALNSEQGASKLAVPMMISNAPVVPPGDYDDADPRIRLHRPWSHDPQFQEASHHTLTYSDVPGASASLAFSGGAVTYVFTRATNRGIAEVWIDGQLKGRLDLYAPATAWKSRRTFANLGSGQHAIEVRVSGEQNPRSTGCYVDLDDFIVE